MESTYLGKAACISFTCIIMSESRKYLLAGNTYISVKHTHMLRRDDTHSVSEYGYVYCCYSYLLV